jgi:hypothetical protein
MGSSLSMGQAGLLGLWIEVSFRLRIPFCNRVMMIDVLQSMLYGESQSANRSEFISYRTGSAVMLFCSTLAILKDRRADVSLVGTSQMAYHRALSHCLQAPYSRSATHVRFSNRSHGWVIYH